MNHLDKFKSNQAFWLIPVHDNYLAYQKILNVSFKIFKVLIKLWVIIKVVKCMEVESVPSGGLSVLKVLSKRNWKEIYYSTALDTFEQKKQHDCAFLAQPKHLLPYYY